MKKLILTISSAALILVMSGCSVNQPKPKNEIDPELPKVNDIKVIEDIDSIGFEWKTILDSNIQGYIIYRSNPQRNDNKLDEITRVDDRYSNHYVDRDLEPNTRYDYRFAVYTNEGTRGVPGETITTQTVPMVDSVSFIEAIQTLPRRAKVIWRPHSARNVQSYIIERKVPGKEWEQLATVDNRLSAEYIDDKLEDNSVYHYRIRVKLYNGLISAPSEIVTTQTKPLPPSVQSISATNDQPKKIVLEWQPVELEDFAYYKVYRKRFFWSYYAKTDKNMLVDEIEDDGVSREYKVTVVDQDGLESLDSAVVKGSTLPKPQAPKIGLIKMDEKSIYVQWYPMDNRAKSYILIKNGEVLLNNLTNTVYTDKDVQPGTEYNYSVISVDEYGLTSQESEEATLFLPLLMESN